jgi:hypothetical protein
MTAAVLHFKVSVTTMDKKSLHHFWTKFRAIKPIYFLVLAIISGVICIVSLRNNNLQMVKLRDAVYTADKNNSDVEGSLRNLREYVYAHMNTELASGPNAVHPPIQLKYTYDRLAKAAGKSGSDSQTYSDAQKYCEAKIPTGFSGSYRLSCIQSYVTSHGGVAIKSIPQNLYQFDFVSPRWSPDAAGWGLLATIVFAVLFVAFWLTDYLVRRSLKHHQ